MKNKKKIRGTILLSMLLMGTIVAAGNDNTIQSQTRVVSTGVTEEASVREDAAGYIEDNIVLPAVEEEQMLGADTQIVSQYRMAAALPVSYDARTDGLVTAVKNQNSDNTCWAYSAASVAESSMISQGKADHTLDLSEEHLAYYFYHTSSDPLGNTTGDTTLPIGGDYLSVGGNYIFTTFALANWIGMADESVENELDWESEDMGAYATTDRVHLQNAYWVNLKANPSHVKRLIQANGAVGTSMYFSETFYNHETYSYYNNWRTGVNHAVTIVGWDDDYSKANFKTQPDRDGAWLIKNSYGEEWGNDGYFWVSYEDAALTQASAKAYAFAFEAADNYDYNYQYDGTAGANVGTDTGYRVDSGEAIANIYSVPMDTKTRYQTIEAVAFALYATNVNYSVQIYHNLADVSDPTSGTAILDVPVTGSTSYVGYYTVPVETDTVLKAGDNFSVVVNLSKGDGSAVSYFVDQSYQNGSWIAFHNETARNQSFAHSTGGWNDLAFSGVSARIKAFTDDYVIPAQKVSVNVTETELWVGQKVSLSATVMPENASYSNIVWTSSDEKIAAVSEDGVVTAIREGDVSITASVIGDTELAASCNVTVKQQATSVKVPQQHYYMKAGNELTIALVLSPQSAQLSSLSWKSSDETVVSVDSKGVIHAIANGTATITVYSVIDGEELASIQLTVNKTGKEPTSAAKPGDTGTPGDRKPSGDTKPSEDKKPSSDTKPSEDTKNSGVTQTAEDKSATAIAATVTALPLTADDNMIGIWSILLIVAVLVGGKSYQVIQTSKREA